MTAAVTSRPMLRVLPLPVMDPPYDDECDPQPPRTLGALALSFTPAGDALPLRLVPPALPRPPAADPAGPPNVRAWTARLAQAIVEVFVGARSAAQLSQVTTLDVLHQLERWSGRFAARGGATQHPRVVSVRVCEPGEGVAEACATIDTGARRRAFALRLEAKGAQWQCTALELG